MVLHNKGYQKTVLSILLCLCSKLQINYTISQINNNNSSNNKNNNNNQRHNKILLNDIFPPSSKRCLEQQEETIKHHNTSQTFSYTFQHKESKSDWSSVHSPFEKNVYLSEISHIDTINKNQSWTIRIGKGGNIYSFIINEFGNESIPPQFNKDAPWMDEVWQMVSVDTLLNNNNNKHAPYFIHEAGVYNKDTNYTTNNNTFYSPNLAIYCDDTIYFQCSFVSWGQHASVPTALKSFIIYYTRYTDCGNGVMEVTSIIHNAASINDDNNNDNVVDRFNVLWGGVRISTLKHLLSSTKYNTTLHNTFPLDNFGSIQTVPLHETIGYTIFAQNAPLSNDLQFIMPCANNHNNNNIINHDTTEQKEQCLDLKINGNNTCRFSQGHSNRYYKGYCVSLNIQKTMTLKIGCLECNIIFINNRTKAYIHVQHVIHWSWNGSYLYFCPVINTTTDVDINNMFFDNDSIIIDYDRYSSISWEDNLSLTLVHGKGIDIHEQYNYEWSLKPSVLRYGKTMRDYNVFTVIEGVDLRPGDTYINRQFFIVDKLQQSNNNAKKYWVNETLNDFIYFGEYTSNVKIQLYSVDDTSFGLAIEENNINANDASSSCSQGTIRCTGSPVPQIGSSALYSIHCGENNVYLGHDAYALSSITSSAIRSYACKILLNNRPEWKLIGYFPINSCDYLKNAWYDENFCDYDDNNVLLLDQKNDIFSLGGGNEKNNIFEFNNKLSWNNVSNTSRKVLDMKEYLQYYFLIRR